jgi:hypothetical protein
LVKKINYNKFNNYLKNNFKTGKGGRKPSSLFANRFLKGIVTKFDYLLVLVTTENFKSSSVHARADLNDEFTKRMALTLKPQIIIHNAGVKVFFKFKKFSF